MQHPQDLYGDPDLKLEGLSLWALAREFPESDDFWDGNWLVIHAVVEARDARVDLRGPHLRTDEVEGFLDQLVPLQKTLMGSAELACMEPYLNVKVACGALGHVKVIVEIPPDLPSQSHRFEFRSDQTWLGQATRGCRTILAKYPVKNAPRP